MEELHKKLKEYKVFSTTPIPDIKYTFTKEVDNTKKALNIIKILVDAELMEEPGSMKELLVLVDKISINI